VSASHLARSRVCAHRSIAHPTVHPFFHPSARIV
jgi:hypothetical protein